VKIERDVFVTYSYSILTRWRKHFSQLFNVHGDNDIRHTAEPLMSEQSDFEFEMAIGNLKRDKSPGTDQIPAECFKTWSRTIRTDIQTVINSILNKEELPEEWKELIIVPIYNKSD
jgi:hypothetical protein